MLSSLVACYLFFSLIRFTPGLAFEYEVHRIIKEVDTENMWIVDNLKAKKIRKGVTAFDGYLDLLKPLGEESKFNLKVFYSSNGSDKYDLLPYHLTPGSMCDFLNNEYKKYVPDLPKYSDFPDTTKDKHCPLKAGRYNVRKYEWDASSIPAIFKPGYYKVELIFEIPESNDRAIISIFLKVFL